MLSCGGTGTVLFPLTVLLLLLDADLVFAASCETRPLYLPIRNATTCPASEMTKGVALGIGNPIQHVVLQPSLMINSTFIPRYVSGSDGCYDDSESLSDVPCIETYGGGFITARSSTWTTDPAKANLRASSYDRRIDKDSNLTNGFDTLRLEDGSNLDIPSMPVVLPNDAFGNFSNSPLGLGEDSVFISALQSSSYIPTKSWGLDANGLCLGCVDAAASSGNFVTVPVGDPVEKNCALQVNVVSVDYKPANGSAEKIISSGTFPACVEPGASSLVLPEAVMEAYEAASGAEKRISDFATVAEFSLRTAKPDGALIFTLADDFRVEVTLNPKNTSDYWRVPLGAGGWGSYQVGTFVLGQPFTDEVYLKYDDAAKEYGIAASNKHSTQDIQGLGCELKADTPAATPRGSSASSSPSSGGKFSTGALVAAAVGGILGTFLLTGSGGWLWWRRQNRKVTNQGSRQGIEHDQKMQVVGGSDSIPQLAGRIVHEADEGTNSGYPAMRPELG